MPLPGNWQEQQEQLAMSEELQTLGIQAVEDQGVSSSSLSLRTTVDNVAVVSTSQLQQEPSGTPLTDAPGPPAFSSLRSSFTSHPSSDERNSRTIGVAAGDERKGAGSAGEEAYERGSWATNERVRSLDTQIAAKQEELSRLEAAIRQRELQLMRVTNSGGGAGEGSPFEAVGGQFIVKAHSGSMDRFEAIQEAERYLKYTHADTMQYFSPSCICARVPLNSSLLYSLPLRHAHAALRFNDVPSAVVKLSQTLSYLLPHNTGGESI